MFIFSFDVSPKKDDWAAYDELNVKDFFKLITLD
jgi:hypothetical protein